MFVIKRVHLMIISRYCLVRFPWPALGCCRANAGDGSWGSQQNPRRAGAERRTHVSELTAAGNRTRGRPSRALPNGGEPLSDPRAGPVRPCRLPVRALGEYVPGGRVDAMRTSEAVECAFR